MKKHSWNTRKDSIQSSPIDAKLNNDNDSNNDNSRGRRNDEANGISQSILHLSSKIDVEMRNHACDHPEKQIDILIRLNRRHLARLDHDEIFVDIIQTPLVLPLLFTFCVLGLPLPGQLLVQNVKPMLHDFGVFARVNVHHRHFVREMRKIFYRDRLAFVIGVDFEIP